MCLLMTFTYMHVGSRVDMHAYAVFAIFLGLTERFEVTE